jgi:hypothetical protein
MRAVRCPVGLNPQVVNLKTFEDLRRNVGDLESGVHVTSFAVGRMWNCWCDEDGELKGLPFNRHVNGTAVFGTYVLARSNHEPKEDDLPFGDMTPQQAKALADMVRQR